MIKACKFTAKGPLLIAGLTEENVARLKAEQPIIATLASFGTSFLGGSLAICYGRTEREIEAYFRREGLITDKTRKVDDSTLDAHLDLKESEAKVLIATIGLPRSGKSTWARAQAYPVVCPDEIRTALHGHRFIAEAEPFVWAIARVMVRSLFGAGHQFVILDACNTTRKRRDEWQSPEWATRFRSFFEPVDTCIGRAVADGDEELIPIIKRMAEQFEPRADDEVPFQ